MKKLLLIIMAIIALGLNVQAEDRKSGQMALLNSTNHTEAFYGPDALIKAYEVAAELAPGLEDEFRASITLTPGMFYSPETIDLPITIIGTYGFAWLRNENPLGNYGAPAINYSRDLHTVLDETTVSTDDVSFEGICFPNAVHIGNVNNCHFKRCFIQSLTATGDHTGTLVEECVVLNEGGIGRSTDYQIRNTTICKFTAANTNKATITNCFVYFWKEVPNGTSYVPYATYANNELGIYIKNDAIESNRNITITGNSEFNNNLFCFNNGYLGTLNEYDTWETIDDEEVWDPGYSVKFNCPNSGNKTSVLYEGFLYGDYHYLSWIYPNFEIYPTLEKDEIGMEAGIVGTDGKPVGVAGGQGMKSHPNIPRVISSSIDKIADEEGKVKINITFLTPDFDAWDELPWYSKKQPK